MRLLKGEKAHVFSPMQATCAIELELFNDPFRNTVLSDKNLGRNQHHHYHRLGVHVQELFTVDVLLNLTLAAISRTGLRVESAKTFEERIVHLI